MDDDMTKPAMGDEGTDGDTEITTPGMPATEGGDTEGDDDNTEGADTKDGDDDTEGGLV